MKSKGGRLSNNNSLNTTRPTNSGPSRSIIVIPLVLVTAFCFSYIQYNSAGNGTSDAGSHAMPHASENTPPLTGAPSLTTTQSELAPISASVAAPDSNQKLTSQTASQAPTSPTTQSPQPSARSSQSLQSSKGSAEETEANNPQRGSSKSQSIKLDEELPQF
jgi:hypothetical protein